MPNELKPCPFCGGKVSVWHNLATDNYDIECQECCCDVQQHYGCVDEAIEAWNRRADNG
jgi:Lar family restriction alleviation protein